VFAQPFHVLPCCDQHSFDIYLLQASQTETSQSVKLLGFTKQRFNPYTPFPRRFLIWLGLMISSRFVNVFLVEGAKYVPPAFATCAFVSHWTSITYFRIGSINKLLLTLAP
jgi:hypothetical protein